jgi:hypothetical protein
LLNRKNCYQAEKFDSRARWTILASYLVREVAMEVLDITFKNPSEARQHAVCEYLVIVF